MISRFYNLQFITIHSLLHIEPIRYTWITQYFILSKLLLLVITADNQEFIVHCLTFSPLIPILSSVNSDQLQEHTLLAIKHMLKGKIRSEIFDHGDECVIIRFTECLENS
jgi:hypothetical protein